MKLALILILVLTSQTKELRWEDLQGAWEQVSKKPAGFVILHDQHIVVISAPRGAVPRSVSGMRYDKVESVGDELHAYNHTRLAEKKMVWTRSVEDGREYLNQRFIVEPTPGNGEGFTVVTKYVRQNTLEYRSVVAKILESQNPNVQDYERKVLESWMKASLKFKE